MSINCKSNAARFEELLKATGAEGVDAVMDGLKKLGFFIAPASTRHHLAEQGGLCQHSLNVYDQAMSIRSAQIAMNPQIADRLTERSVALAALLHDVCKAEVYKPVEKFRKDANNQWEKYQTYDHDYSHSPFGHGEKSVIRLLLMGMKLTRDEMLAIRWHMSAWELPDSFEARGNFNAACDATPLVALIIAADELACRITENPAFSQWEVKL